MTEWYIYFVKKPFAFDELAHAMRDQRYGLRKVQTYCTRSKHPFTGYEPATVNTPKCPTCEVRLREELLNRLGAR